MRILIVDNYDSFTFNLYQQIARVGACEPIVRLHDEISIEEIQDLSIDGVVLSPGPGRPDRPQDFGVCSDLIAAPRWPILGVCLGFQGIVDHWGGTVERAPEPVHGRLSRILHRGSGLFRGLPQGFQAVRYHSLAVGGEIPKDLEATAWTDDGILMGIRHRTLPVWGIQFHPESVCTEYGDNIVAKFLESCRGATSSGVPRTPESPQDGSTLSMGARVPHSPDLSLRIEPSRPAESSPAKATRCSLIHRKLEIYVDPDDVFSNLFADEDYAYWLDSSLAGMAESRFSFMGSTNPDEGCVIQYKVGNQQLTVRRDGAVYIHREDIFSFLNKELERVRCFSPELPFDFNCGFVGYFGYELKAECGARAAHNSRLPDAVFLSADRVVAFDHEQHTIYLLALVRGGRHAEAETWLSRTEERLQRLEPASPVPSGSSRGVMSFQLSRPYETYLRDIDACLRKIYDGESYEVCLTNQLYAEPVSPPLDVYRNLRLTNPAPYAAYLKLGDVAILCSSPEQFLNIDQHRWVSSKPIKGTLARGTDAAGDLLLKRQLAESLKDRAENLMIVDLVRNDLGRVCEVGSVHVPALMNVESYATVHQLVSTVRGRLRADRSAIDCVRACFPGGSMTGAPKIRTMEIIDDLEGEARGVYSGAIGFLALNGSASLNIVIRTIVMTPDLLSVGCGGAIVALSDPDSEFEETLLKSKALIRALVTAATGDFREDLYTLQGAPSESCLRFEPTLIRR